MAPLSLCGLAFFFEEMLFYGLLGLSFGYLFHLIADLMSEGGIKGFFFPFGSRSLTYALLPRRFRFKTNGFMEKHLRALLGISFFYQMYLIYTLGGVR